jgi:phage terminase large subunit GpA-like protein
MTVSIPDEIITQWAPPEGLSVSKWAEKHRVLVPETSSEPGPWRNYRTPYLTAIMDAFSNPYIEKIVFNKGSQIGGTEVLFNMLGYAIHQDPAPALYIMPTLELAKYASRSRIQPMVNASPALTSLKPANEDDFTTFSMLFPGMVLTLAGANSPASLASRPCRYVFLDEVNKFPRFTGNEADPISLATERQKTFWNKKTVIISTPTEEDGPITRELSMCDVVFDFWVPCPHCGEMQVLKFVQFKWPKELDRKDPLYASKVRESAWYECERCSEIVNDLHRPGMIQGGEWKPKQAIKTQPRSVGFSLPSFYSPWLTWGDIAEAFVKSQDYPEKLMNVINSWFAEPWVQRIRTSTDSEILKARAEELEPQTVPEEAVALTCGIDCQKYGFWFVVRAWATDMTSWMIHYGQLATWEDLEELLFDTEYPGNGRPHRIWRAAIDTGGGDVDDGMTMTEAAYWWIRANGVGRSCRVWGTKGSSHPLSGKLHVGKALDKTPSGKVLPGGLQLVMIDTDQMKDAYHYRLKQAIDHLPQASYLHRSVGLDYVSHILSEEKRKDRRGREEWVQIRKDNHLFDCELLAMACAEPEWPGGGVNLIRRATPKKERGDEWQDQPQHQRRTVAQRPQQNMQGRVMNPWQKR